MKITSVAGIRKEMVRQKLSFKPQGWDYNPSAWRCRGPIIVMAVIDLVIAGYLTLYQYGVVDQVWEPFFNNGSQLVLDSWISHALPISDAALGALAYAFDVVLGIYGDETRWRTKPWVVVLFMFFIGPVGLTSLVLVMLQPLSVGAWCTLCLLSAALSIAMIGPAMDEGLATLQYLKRVADHDSINFWSIFWKGKA